MRKGIRFVWMTIIVICILISILVVSSAIILSKYSKTYVDEDLISAVQAYGKTTLYSRNMTGNDKNVGVEEFSEAATLDGGIKHIYVSYYKLPKDLLNAFISIEDKRFYDHSGIDYIRSGKAVVSYIFGNASLGGSTITQQLVKNITGNDEFSINRKLSEAFSALDLESRYDKTEILEMYLNIINLSNGCRGVGAAADYYFSKNVDELSLNESAVIAAITNNPSKYDPIRHKENCKKRRDTVLLCMYQQGYISEREFKNATAEPIRLKISEQNAPNHINSWYTDMVIDDVVSDMSEKYGMSKKSASYLLLTGGYKIYTAMDASIQNILDDYYSDQSNFTSDITDKHPQSSMIVIDPYSGDILGVAGAVGKKRGNRVQNYATDTLRPPGSAIKPLSVYAPAFEKGIIDWSTIIEDSPIWPKTEKTPPWPMNANKKYVGDVNIKNAVEHSLNTVPVKLLHQLGNESSFEFLTKKLHITSLDRYYDMGDASLALGQPSRGISLRELVSAYSIFEEGIISRSRSYYKMTDKDGNIILENPLKQEPVISEENSAIMTKLMQAVVESGTASGLIRASEITEIAGKTGTTQYNNDKYFIGYTPALLAGVWFGYEYPEPIEGFGGNFSAIVWDDIIGRIYSETEYKNLKREFPIPSTVQRLSYDKKTGEQPNKYTIPEDIEDGWFKIEN